MLHFQSFVKNLQKLTLLKSGENFCVGGRFRIGIAPKWRSFNGCLCSITLLQNFLEC